MSKIDKYLNEGKNDYNASYSGITIIIKNGYKYYKEEELQSLYDQAGKMAKKSKINIAKVEITPLSLKGRKI